MYGYFDSVKILSFLVLLRNRVTLLPDVLFDDPCIVPAVMIMSNSLLETL